MISEPWPADSTDVNGVLLGFKKVGEKRWFVYLVGLSRDQKVEETRMAALAAAVAMLARRNKHRREASAAPDLEGDSQNNRKRVHLQACGICRSKLAREPRET